ncbi:hypothetical protein JAAARDRAFT_39330 [Jaapia argillacea MUCL 33604]|uniref:Uncharacterized protein n=1 Tax=Jaapia argillacea MUCL 33604 TaxID=933084 RepID=A0A067PHE6_9AGAM|nr:hypothetical protein JAAARDRAFT_39330 [Jaapia argillacea MUCL 33604]
MENLQPDHSTARVFDPVRTTVPDLLLPNPIFRSRHQPDFCGDDDDSEAVTQEVVHSCINMPIYASCDDYGLSGSLLFKQTSACPDEMHHH